MPRFAFLLALAVAPAFPAALAPAQQAGIARIITAEMSRANVPGLSAAIGLDNEILYTAAFGLSDIENGVPVKTKTVFRTASIAKPITATAVLQLAAAKKIDLDAPIQRYVPAFPQKPWPITVRQLLAHQSGIRHYLRSDEIDSTAHYSDLAACLRIFQSDPLVAEPGTRFHYTSYGYVLLGAAVEAAAPKDFSDYLREFIFNPAGMERTRPDSHYAIIPNRAHGYSISASGKLQNCALADTSNKVPGGGLLSTPEDLVRFALALRRGALLRASYVDLMFTPTYTRDHQRVNYALGWKVSSFDHHSVVWHDGGQQGVSTVLVLLPKERLSIALMCNLERVKLYDLAARIAHFMLDTPAPDETTARRRTQ